MITNYDNRIDDKYPYGAYCPCGRVHHLAEYEVCVGVNPITCPYCGYTVNLITYKSINMYSNAVYNSKEENNDGRTEKLS